MFYIRELHKGNQLDPEFKANTMRGMRATIIDALITDYMSLRLPSDPDYSIA